MKLRTMTILTLSLMILSLAAGCGGEGEGEGGSVLDMAAGLNLGKDLSGMLGEATRLLGGITDLDSAKAALPKLAEMDGGLDDIVAKAKELSPENKEKFVEASMAAVPALEGAVSKLTAMPGVGDTLKPTLDSILGKVKGMM
jgi:hypothetical protein